MVYLHYRLRKGHKRVVDIKRDRRQKDNGGRIKTTYVLICNLECGHVEERSTLKTTPTTLMCHQCKE